MCFILFSLLSIFISCIYGNTYEIVPDNIFSAGHLLYNSLKLDPKSASLYVAGKDSLFRLWIYNINDTSSESLYAKKMLVTEKDDKEECIKLGNSELECANWIREIFQTSNGDLIICVSQAMKPNLMRLNGLSLSTIDEPTISIGVCSTHANTNTTAIYVEEGNPDGLPGIYSGIRTGLSQENHLIYRPPLIKNGKEIFSSMRSVFTDSKWLNEPQFVGAFDEGNYVYFFFREIAVEFEGCGKTIYSRVARICKNDLGGKNVMKQVWTSFIKARLNCSLSTGSFPFYFDHIESIFKVKEDNDVYFYASMRTAESPFQASAVCVYSLNQINQLFNNGILMEQPNVNSLWVQTPPENIIGKRPGSCVSDSRILSDSDLHFAKNHLLIADSVSGGEPLIFDRDKLYSTILVDTFDKENGNVIFVHVPADQEIIKFSYRKNENGQNIVRKLVNLKISTFKKVNALSILPNEYLFIADDDKVAQFRLAQCDAYENCASCASDPYCSWNIIREECFFTEKHYKTTVGWISGSLNVDKCNTRIKGIEKVLYPGDSYILKGKINSIWKKNGKILDKDSENLVFIKNGGLLIFNATSDQTGTYECLLDNIRISLYNIVIDNEKCTQPKSIEQFRSIQREWCKKFDSYKTNLAKWQSWYDKNAHCPRVPEELNGKMVPPLR
uniref:Semaphorin-2A (projected from Caenorhabditis elegans ortholog mab-20) n=1 Tax=Strongyloides venezuelensis TaxID=75913 RepID=A0A0K0F980_STRVS